MRGRRWARRNGLLAALAAAVLVPATMAAASGPARPVTAGLPGSGHAAAAGVIATLAGSVGGPGRATSVGVPACGVSVNNGSLYVADSGSVRKISPATDALATPAGTGVRGPVADGKPATRASFFTCGTTVDAAGNLVIADGGNNRVRVAAAKTGTFYGQAMTAGDIYTVAGGGDSSPGNRGPATQASLDSPSDVTPDAAGNLVIADTFHERIRVVAAKTGTFYGQGMKAGDIYAIAGNGRHGFSGDGGPALSASLPVPVGVAVDSAGNVAIADSRNNRVRVVAARSGTFYGVAMQAGHIYTVAGDGFGGFSGDGG